MSTLRAASRNAKERLLLERIVLNMNRQTAQYHNNTLKEMISP